MDLMTTGLLILLMVASFYLLIIRPSRKRQADQARLASTMQPGVRVMLSSGIYGTVTEVGDRQAFVEVAPGVTIRVLKQAVLQVVTADSQFAEDGTSTTGTLEREIADSDIAGSQVVDPLADRRPEGPQGEKN